MIIRNLTLNELYWDTTNIISYGDLLKIESSIVALQSSIPFSSLAGPVVTGLMNDSSALYNRINNIPIYLVTTNQSTHRIPFQEMGQTIYVDVPEDRFADVPEDRFADVPEDRFADVPEDRFADVPEDRFADVPEDRFADVHCSLDDPRYPVSDDVIKSNSEKCVISDLLGVYVSQFKSKSSTGFAEKKSEIFLWVDKIKMSGGKPLPLIRQVLVHELAHAIMDVHEYPFFNPDYYLFREESLANALSLYIMGKIYKHNSNNYKFLVEFVSKQPLQYALGLLYNDKLTITSAMGRWMEIKALKAFNAPNNSLPKWVNNAVSLLGSISRPLNSLGNIPASIFYLMKKTDLLL